jgi:hypothetical protein
MLIVITHRGRLWRTNLTDRREVWGVRQHTSPQAALTEVLRLCHQGHRPAFQSALLDLMQAAETADGPQAAA